MEEILDKFNNVDNPILAIFICHMTYVSFLQGFPISSNNKLQVHIVGSPFAICVN